MEIGLVVTEKIEFLLNHVPLPKFITCTEIPGGVIVILGGW